MKWESAAALVAAALVSAACADSKPAPPPATTAPAATVAPATTAPAATVATSEFGVPECDEYMNKWMACVDSKVPAEARGTYKAAIEQSKVSWKQAAATPQGKQMMATACVQQLAATKQALAAYNCTW
ncbi:MAG: hypothetical protein ABW221_13705 [Vicinamibacteria bacterium]